MEYTDLLNEVKKLREENKRLKDILKKHNIPYEIKENSKLNTTVYAPRTTLWAEANGSYYISESQSGSVREEFKAFYPRKGKSR